MLIVVIVYFCEAGLLSVFKTLCFSDYGFMLFFYSLLVLLISPFNPKYHFRFGLLDIIFVDYFDRGKFFFFLLQQWLIVLCVYYSMLVSMVTLELKYSPPGFSGLQIFHQEISYYFEEVFFFFT